MITGTISFSDYLSAQRLHRAASVRWYYLAALVAIAIGAGIYCSFSQSAGLIIASAGIGGLVGELVVARVFLPWRVRRLYAQQKDLASPFTYSWTSAFIEARGISGHSKRAWESYAKYKEDERLFLLYHADNLFEMFPKSWFRDQSQIREFRELASRVGERPGR